MGVLLEESHPWMGNVLKKAKYKATYCQYVTLGYLQAFGKCDGWGLQSVKTPIPPLYCHALLCHTLMYMYGYLLVSSFLVLHTNLPEIGICRRYRYQFFKDSDH